MKFTEWIRHRIVGRFREPDYRELQEIAQKAKRLAGVYNHGELAKLIREYSHSEKAIEQIALLIAKSEPFVSPISTMNKESVDMMDVLTDTPFMAKHGSQLTDIPPWEATSVHGLFAMYTIMHDWGCTKYPMNRIERPPHSEVISAIRILDFQRKSRDVSELCELASYNMVPSTYVKLRYGIEDKCSTYEWLESYLMDRDDCCIEPDVRMNIPRIEAEMCAAAEKAVENIPGVRLPDFYLEGLNRDLYKLGRIAVSPDASNDLINVQPDFLIKYGIDKPAAPEEQSRQAQKAYKELDDRLVRVTSRRPYADEFFASLRHGKEKVAEVDRPRPVHKPILRNPPSKGRKMGI